MVGNNHIRSDFLIALNNYMNMDVPDHSFVIGNPEIIPYKYYAMGRYVKFMIDNTVD